VRRVNKWDCDVRRAYKELHIDVNRLYKIRFSNVIPNILTHKTIRCTEHKLGIVSMKIQLEINYNLGRAGVPTLTR